MIKRLSMLLCYLGIHKFSIIDIRFGFGAAGSTETVKCKVCGIQKVRQTN
jgi:hypothetical protein|tara:strand:- start:589 stop:738 length:150 start_codon:yes stop_codon:yes gene_type:complete